jgi:hypothetical protein
LGGRLILLQNSSDASICEESDNICQFCGKVLINSKSRYIHESCCKKKLTVEKTFEEEFEPREEEQISLISFCMKTEKPVKTSPPMNITNSIKENDHGLTNGLVRGIEIGRRGMTNGLINGLNRSRQGLTNGLTNGKVNGLRRSRKGLTNGLTNGKINGLRRSRKGLTNGLTNGKINGLRRSRQGLTNGLTNGKINGLRRSRQGLTNGLTNGKINGLRRSRQGLTNGMTNGLRAISHGLTNGITNGSGITNGLGWQKRLVEDKPGRRRIFAFLVVFSILLILFALPIETIFPSNLVEIDGNFDDWKDVTSYRDEQELALPDNLDIVDYRVKEDIVSLSFYLKVKGAILKGDSLGHVDTVHIFIDLDSNSSTGYLIKGMGADYMIRIYGKDGVVRFSYIFEFNSANQYSLNGFLQRGKVGSAASGSELEAGITHYTIGMVKKQPVEIYFHIQDYRGIEDFSDALATNIGGTLVVSQSSTIEQDIIDPNSNQPVLKLNLQSLNDEIVLSSITVTKPTGTATVPLKMSGDFTGNANFIGDMATFQINEIVEMNASITIYADTLGLDGKAVGFRIACKDDVVVESGAVFLITEKIRYAYVDKPEQITVDGAFGDWNRASAPHDNPDDVGNANIDITNYYAKGDEESDKLYFYLEVHGDMLEGKLVPFINDFVYTEPIEGPETEIDTDRDTVPDSIDPYPNDFDNDGVDDKDEGGDIDSDRLADYSGGDDKWLNTTLPLSFPVLFKGKKVSVYIGPGPSVPEVAEMDATYVFLDTDDDSSTGFSIGNIALGADYLLVVKGKEGKIVDKEVKRFVGTAPLNWEWRAVDAVLDAEIDSSQIEIGVNSGKMKIEAGVKVFFKTTDWKERKDGSDNVLECVYSGNQLQVNVGAFVGAKFDPFVVKNQGDVYQSPDASSWTFEGNPDECFRWVGIASGSGSTAGYVFLLRSDGKAYFTDRGVNGWYEYGYGSPPISDDTSYVDIAAGSGSSSGYVYVLRNDGKVFFTDRGVNGWYEYGYGSPEIETSTAYVSIASGSGSTNGYVYVLRNDGKVFFTDRGVNGWYQYGYGSPSIETSTAYVGIAAGSGSSTGYVYVLRNDGKVFFTDRGVNGWYEYGYGSPAIESSTAYVSIASGSGSATGYVYVLRNDGKVFFTDRGVNGWYEYGYGSPSIGTSKAYVGIACGKGSTTSGYLYVLHGEGIVSFTDRGVNGWHEYGYGSPQLPTGVWYEGIAAYSEEIVFVLLSNGSVYKSEDGGGTWSYFDDAGDDDNWVDIAVTFPSNVYTLNNEGDVMRSPIGSASWTSWGDAGSGTSWISITTDSDGYLYVLRNDGEVSYATESSSTWNSKGDAGEYTSWVAIAAYDGEAGSYVYAMRNNRSITRALVGTSSSWSAFVTEGEDTSWVSMAVDSTYIYTLRNDGTIDRAVILSEIWSEGFGDVGDGTSFVDISTVVSEFRIIIIPLLIIITTYCVMKKRKREAIE